MYRESFAYVNEFKRMLVDSKFNQIHMYKLFKDYFRKVTAIRSVSGVLPFEYVWGLFGHL